MIEDGLGGGFGTLYICALLAISVLNLLIANHLVHHPELTDGETTQVSREHVAGSAFSVAALVIAVIISLLKREAHLVQFHSKDLGVVLEVDVGGEDC